MNRKERRREESQKRNPDAVWDAGPLFRDAFSLHQQGKLAEASALYQQILMKDPRHADSLHLLGMVRMQMNDPAGGAELMQMAIQYAPDRLLYYLNYGNALVSLGRLEDALRQYEHILSQDPHHAQAMNNAGNALKQLYRLDESASYFRKAIETKPDYMEAYSNYAGTLDLMGKVDEALAMLGKAIELNPFYAQAYFNYATICMRINQDESVNYFRKSLEVRPNHLPTLAKLGQLLRRMGRIAEATECLQLAVMIDPDDNFGLKAPLAELTSQQLPERVSDQYLQNIYANRASSWDKAIAATGEYRAPALAADMVARFHEGSKPYRLMDAGCGTGLVGELLRKGASQMDGVDISASMLAMAKNKGIYDTLHQGDMVSLLASAKDPYDVITCVATLLHFGNLLPALKASAAALRKGGLMVISLFYYDNESDPVGYASSLIEGSYRHTKSYINRVAPEAGFEVMALETPMHEKDSFGAPVTGLMVALRKL